MAWVTRPERPKGVKDEVKRPEGPPARSRGTEGPQTSSIIYGIYIHIYLFSQNKLAKLRRCMSWVGFLTELDNPTQVQVYTTNLKTHLVASKKNGIAMTRLIYAGHSTGEIEKNMCCACIALHSVHCVAQ